MSEQNSDVITVRVIEVSTGDRTVMFPFSDENLKAILGAAKSYHEVGNEVLNSDTMEEVFVDDVLGDQYCIKDLQAQLVSVEKMDININTSEVVTPQRPYIYFL